MRPDGYDYGRTAAKLPFTDATLPIGSGTPFCA
jgi:hypothetical protein